MERQKKKPRKWIIKYSCLTGKAVWVYRNTSKAAVTKAYYRACKAEIERVRNWPRTVAEYRASILKFLNACTAGMPIGEDMPPEKAEAARKLLAMADDVPVCDMEFYNHIMESRRRRQEDAEIRRKMREHDRLRDKGNKDYGKQGK